MPSPSDAHPSTPSTTPFLGPHVVGQRVVVRRVLPGETGPSGGPAMTDVLGVCTAWGEGRCVVEPESGPRVEIRFADIVSGKPVPPRPSVHARVTPREAQLRGTTLFADLRTEPLGGWVLRSSPAETARRANSVLAFGPSGVEDAYERVVDFYARTPSGRPVAAVLPGSPEEELFRSRGWTAESTDADTLFQLAAVSRVAREIHSIVRVPGVVEGSWNVHTRTIERTPPAGPDLPDTPALRDAELAELTLVEDGTVIAGGVAAYADDWVGMRSIQVDPARRRAGLGVRVVAELLDWGAERGARTAYLQVLADNAPALGLYERLGFRTHHAYRYLAPPPR